VLPANAQAKAVSTWKGIEDPIESVSKIPTLQWKISCRRSLVRCRPIAEEEAEQKRQTNIAVLGSIQFSKKQHTFELALMRVQ
jgi:hypothetical protein